MKPPDKDLLLSSRVDFTIPSPVAREHLYYLIQYRRYQCVPGYPGQAGIFWICTCARMCAAVRCTPSAESRARTLLPDSLYSWTAAFPPVLRHRADRASLVSLFRRRKRAFNSASHFSRVFRSRENMTPSKFLSMNF